MYLSGTTNLRIGPSLGRAVPPAVIGLGAVSLVTDISSEMVTAALPLYLVYGLGLGYLQLGLIDGLYTGLTSVLRLAGGYMADRFGSPKAVALAGYTLSTLSRLGFPLAGGSVGGLGLVVTVDRAGKGLRTAPRDALITMATPQASRGRAFGVHRAMDTFGALLGPLAAFWLLALTANDFTSVFVASFIFGAIGVVVLASFVRVPPTDVPATARPRLRDAIGMIADRANRRVCLAAILLGAVTVGDMFLFLAVQQRTGLPSAILPLLPLGTAGIFMVAAIPIGRLADRVGRWRTFVGGHVLLLAAYLLVAAGGSGWPVAAGILVLHGLFYATTDGVLMAFAATSMFGPLLVSGLAAVQTGQVLARAAGAIGFGALAAALTLPGAFLAETIALAVAITVVATLRIGGTR